MSCPDVKHLLYGDPTQEESRELRQHVENCEACRLEWERLQVTVAALRSVPAEEPITPIRFVSDRVFEPTWWQKLLSLELRHVAWQALLVLPLLLVASAYLGSRFAAAPVVHNAGGTATAEFRMTAETDAHIRQLVDQQVKAQVTKVVAEMESEDAKQTQALLASFREQYHRDHQGLLRALDTAYQQQNQRMNRVMYATLEKIPVAN